MVSNQIRGVAQYSKGGKKVEGLWFVMLKVSPIYKTSDEARTVKDSLVPIHPQMYFSLAGAPKHNQYWLKVQSSGGVPLDEALVLSQTAQQWREDHPYSDPLWAQFGNITLPPALQPTCVQQQFAAYNIPPSMSRGLTVNRQGIPSKKAKERKLFKNKLTQDERQAMYVQQNGKCNLCFAQFYTWRYYNKNAVMEWLTPEEEHFDPRNSRERKGDYLACVPCNDAIKRAHLFGSIEEARFFVAKAYEDSGATTTGVPGVRYCSLSGEFSIVIDSSGKPMDVNVFGL